MSELDELERLLNKAKSDERILAIVIYGSYARNEPYNDIDICIFCFPSKYSTDLELEYRLFLPEKYDVRFFDTLPLYIKSRVLNDGIIKLDKNYKILFDVYIETIKNYNLFEPHFKTFLDAVKNG